jgi:hypothetical protein
VDAGMTSLRTVTIQIYTGLDDDPPRLVGTVDVDPFTYYQDFADGLRGMADDIEALGRDERQE